RRWEASRPTAAGEASWSSAPKSIGTVATSPATTSPWPCARANAGRYASPSPTITLNATPSPSIARRSRRSWEPSRRSALRPAAAGAASGPGSASVVVRVDMDSVRKDQAANDLVGVVIGTGQRMAEHRAAALDGAHDAVGRMPGANAVEDAGDHPLPGLVGAECPVDGLVAEDDDPMLEEADVDQDAGAARGLARDMGAERFEGPAIRGALELVLPQRPPP